MQTETVVFCSDWMEDAVTPVEYIRSSDLATDSTTENLDFTGLMQGNNFTYRLAKAGTRQTQHWDLLHTMC